jgi:rhamnogalacturonan endolyase
MNTLRFIRPPTLLAVGFITLIVSTSLVLAAQVSLAAVSHNSNVAVTVKDDARSFTLDNGVVKAIIRKDSGSMGSLLYKGVEMMGGNGGYWEQTPEGAPTLTNTVTIDPTANNGARAEVSIKGVTGGTQMLGRGAPGGGTYCDMEIRYALGRGDSGIYVYAIFNHPASYRAGGVGSESRYITRLSQTFDWITVDKDRNMLEAAPTDWGTGVVVHAKEQRIMDKGVYKNSVEHKYSYSGVQYKTPAYGWSSTNDHIGIWFINPTIEYLSGGPTKLELDDHFGDNDNPEPIILDYWLGGHYDTGARANVAAGEEWHKVVGPIFIYVNSLDHPQAATPSELATLAETAGNPTVPASWTANANALWQDALAQARKENAKWPYDWVTNADYPHATERGAVSGQIVLDDPLAPKSASKKFSHLLVGLTAPDSGNLIWIHNAKAYQFWGDASDDGRFTLAKVRPGTYTLHAFSTGVLGDFAQADITVLPGKTVDLGKLVWKPVRDGKQLWEIGYPAAPVTSFSKATGPTTGFGAGTFVTPCSSPTTSPTP